MAFCSPTVAVPSPIGRPSSALSESNHGRSGTRLVVPERAIASCRRLSKETHGQGRQQGPELRQRLQALLRDERESLEPCWHVKDGLCPCSLRIRAGFRGAARAIIHGWINPA